MGFKDRLKEKRVEANLTQAALAEKVSVTARTIQNYELGTRKPTTAECSCAQHRNKAEQKRRVK